MITIQDMLKQAILDGYTDENAEAKVCQDIVLKALSKSSLNLNATIKGGVVMRSITGNSRRATLDMDIDFIRYSLGDAAIMHFIDMLNVLSDFRFEQFGVIEELKQQEYHGSTKKNFILKNDFQIPMTTSKEVNIMCNLGEGIAERAEARGIAIGEARSADRIRELEARSAKRIKELEARSAKRIKELEAIIAEYQRKEQQLIEISRGDLML